MDISELKRRYSVLEKKHRLPSFKEINENFEIEKIDKEHECLLRAVRKAIMDKIVNSVAFFDMLVNPSATPRIYMSYVRSMSSEDRKIIEEIYDKLSEISFISLELEINYSEKGEADLIKFANSTWEWVRPKFSKIIKNIKNPSSVNFKKEKNYFG